MLTLVLTLLLQGELEVYACKVDGLERAVADLEFLVSSCAAQPCLLAGWMAKQAYLAHEQQAAAAPHSLRQSGVPPCFIIQL
jgi:hypothetical protein